MKPVHVSADLICVADVDALLGEGPIWDPRDRRLYWVDIKGGKIYAYDPSTQDTEIIPALGEISALGLAKSGGFVCAMRSGFAKLSIEQGVARLKPLCDPEADVPGNRFNDGKVDPAGGFWAGTMDDAELEASGAWWRLGPNGGAVKISSGVHVTNGPAFDVERARVYLTDSALRTVYVASTDGEGLENARTFLQFPDTDGYPDGMTVDRHGALWICFWDGASIRRFSPSGDLLLEIPTPVARPTSLAIVDDRLFVSSARIGLSDRELEAQPTAGGLFEVEMSERLGRTSDYFDDRQV